MTLDFCIWTEALSIAEQLGYSDSMVKVKQVRGLHRPAYDVYVKAPGDKRGTKLASIVVF